MNNRRFGLLSRSCSSMTALVTLIMFLTSSMRPAWTMDSVRGGALPKPLPLFPADNWWNLDISSWPVDPNRRALFPLSMITYVQIALKTIHLS